MSSICGFIDHYSPTPSSDALLKMARAMAHRGRASSVAYIKGGIALHQNNEEGEDLPITLSKDNDSYTMLLDGEFTNANVLTAYLSLPPDTPTAQTVLEAYIAHGTRFISKLEGIFALAIYDDRRKELLLARDRYGVKPLYYLRHGSSIVFASEKRAILSSTEETRDSGLCRDISELAPGELAIYSRFAP